MMRISRLLVAILLAGTGPAVGRDIHVHNRTGDDAASGEAAAPLATAQRAVNLAVAGDTIHLLPEGALYRQAIHIREAPDRKRPTPNRPSPASFVGCGLARAAGSRRPYCWARGPWPSL